MRGDIQVSRMDAYKYRIGKKEGAFEHVIVGYFSSYYNTYISKAVGNEVKIHHSDFALYKNDQIVDIAEIKSIKEYKTCASKWIIDHESEINNNHSLQGIENLSIGSVALITVIICQLKKHCDKFGLNVGWLILEAINQYKLTEEVQSGLDFLYNKNLISMPELYEPYNDYGFIKIIFNTGQK
jgi:hypothetical protein